ncbi:MAG TPA: lasso peptide biosynthesis B2 protein, partial [Phenylobacterium sp.]|nr:lasso peptide biosynthesis B2 protein [Phenylobacterium sp.]
MPSLFVRSGIYLAAVGDDLVALDVQGGDYGCLPGAGRAVPPCGPDGRLNLADEALAAVLLEAGLVDREPAGGARVDLPPSATVSCWRVERASIAPIERRRFVRAYLAAAPRFWRARFGDLVGEARRLGQGPAACADPETLRDAQVFDQLVPWAPFQGECLFRAFLLLAYLRLGGRDATWVFGVRTYPFQAHCWLQI